MWHGTGQVRGCGGVLPGSDGHQLPKFRARGAPGVEARGHRMDCGGAEPFCRGEHHIVIGAGFEINLHHFAIMVA